MSLCINTTTPEGIVLAADSRQSYRNHKGLGRIGSDSATKVFNLNERVGVVIAGIAFLSENGTQKNISGFIEDFVANTDLKKMSVEDISNKMYEFFSQKYKFEDELVKLEDKIKEDLKRQGLTLDKMDNKGDHLEFIFKDKDGNAKNGVAGIDRLSFIVAGYNIDESHQVVMVSLPGGVSVKRDSTQHGNEYGASWIGQTDVVSRIVLGFDPRIHNTPFVQKAVAQSGDQVSLELRGLEYAIQWGTMTLQDGVDFSQLIINTTSAIQRFSDGIVMDPGDMPGVGGPVDVAVITKNDGFKWVKKKEVVSASKNISV